MLIAQAFLADTLPRTTRQAFQRFARHGYRDLVADIDAAQREGDATRDVPAEELAVAVISLVRGLALVRFVYAAVSPVHATPSLDAVLRLVRVGGSRVRRLPPPRGTRSEVGLRARAGRAAAAPPERKGARRASGA